MRFQGDPKIVITANGATLDFQGGQPVMDGGLENFAFISLFTKKGWWGNSVLANLDQHIGSDVELIANQAITATSISDLEKEMRKALESDFFGRVDAEVSNPNSSRLSATVLLEPPGQDAQELTLTREGQNWINQANDPAYRRLS